MRPIGLQLFSILDALSPGSFLLASGLTTSFVIAGITAYRLSRNDKRPAVTQA